jgi:hypothetical protein
MLPDCTSLINCPSVCAAACSSTACELLKVLLETSGATANVLIAYPFEFHPP